MKKQIMIAGMATLLAVAQIPAANAKSSSREEATGVGAGVVIGAAAGGPPGAIIGAAIGALIGDRLHRDKSTIDQLDASLADREQAIDTLSIELGAERRDVHQLRNELALVESSGALELQSVLEQGLTFTATYRTDETTLPTSTEQRLVGIAALLAVTPGLTVRVDGYADPRGSESYNTALSTARADGIRTLLIDAGLQPQAIVVQGHGESTAAAVSEGDLDQLALERRVTITFQRQSDVGVAAVVER